MYERVMHEVDHTNEEGIMFALVISKMIEAPTIQTLLCSSGAATLHRPTILNTRNNHCLLVMPKIILPLCRTVLSHARCRSYI